MGPRSGHLERPRLHDVLALQRLDYEADDQPLFRYRDVAGLHAQAKDVVKSGLFARLGGKR